MSTIMPSAGGGRRLTKPIQAAKQPARTDQRILLTLDQVLAELGGPDGPLSRSTWHDWQIKGTGPKVIKLPNGQVRVARDDLNAWLDGLTRDPGAR
ncbi:DNA-binding protein [Frankia sp. CNm7]|uniref:DNA-binding protein n=1 Tax=Frankia nepalensis TaxID=1836974 RepID=A0A937RJK1_9ACTN|nr:DNA-binding protein [Frankia nepalensis]MBL7498323.1 DNA-binding protein [Frankia nepalensis]MBL7512992.1 DNA-binding protein [Frankia nepalensis]MBL7522942.1 DNA-binding protein [Frankia nepalensis]MBL7630130.1 DNA-binding protein [Frankia nepalensis]